MTAPTDPREPQVSSLGWPFWTTAALGICFAIAYATGACLLGSIC